MMSASEGGMGAHRKADMVWTVPFICHRSKNIAFAYKNIAFANKKTSRLQLKIGRESRLQINIGRASRLHINNVRFCSAQGTPSFFIALKTRACAHYHESDKMGTICLHLSAINYRERLSILFSITAKWVTFSFCTHSQQFTAIF